MQDSWGLRLDRELWTPNALGSLGPHSLLRDLSAGGEMSYRPLLRHHLTEGQLSDSVSRAVEVVEDQAGWDNLANIPEIARYCPPALSEKNRSRWEQGRTVAVVLRNRVGDDFQGVIVARIGDGFDPQVAHLDTFWVWNAAWLNTSAATDILAAGWLALFRGLAQTGAVAITAAETWTGRRFIDVLRNIAGFRPTKAVYADLGLTPADSELVLADWRATIEADQVVHFATRPTLTDDAHSDLLTILDNYFTVVVKHRVGTDEPTPEPPPEFRLTISGQVGIDGAQGWGTGSHDDDWYHAAPDRIPDGTEWMHRGPDLLARWLHDQTTTEHG